MDYGPLATAAIAAFAGIVGSLLTWMGARPKSRAEAAGVDAQTALTSISGFQILVRELQQERVQLAEHIEKQSGLIEKQSGEIAALRSEVSGLRSELEDALTRWRRGDPPPPPVHRRNRS